MKSNYIEIWSTPIAEYFAEQSIHDQIIDLVKNHSGTGPQGNTFSFLHNINNDFTNWVDTCCKDYLSKFYKDDVEFYIKRSWVTQQNYGQPNQTHSHGNTDVVGVYYINSNDNHPELTIYDPRPPHIFNEVSFWNADGVQIADCARSTSVKPVTGKLFFMPGYLLHGVDINISQEPRLSLAMNIKIKRGGE